MSYYSDWKCGAFREWQEQKMKGGEGE